jgi:endonuclease/exonuclease/phosphatase family metal-dependent hydrolase
VEPLRVLTLNLLNDLTSWQERRPLILAEIRDFEPDLVAFQEVSMPGDTLAGLVDGLQGYSVHGCPKFNLRMHREGIAILSRLPVVGTDILYLGRQGRVAQRILVRWGEQQLVFANTHLYWSPVDDPIRLNQVRRLLTWLDPGLPTILCGDFNAFPRYRIFDLIRQRFQSAHAAVHGGEPRFTFPTPLWRGPGLRHSARHKMLRWARRLTPGRCEDNWCETVDYIFVEPSLQVLSCEVCFDQPAAHDDRLYPSDHLGLTAQILPA